MEVKNELLIGALLIRPILAHINNGGVTIQVKGNSNLNLKGHLHQSQKYPTKSRLGNAIFYY